MWSGGPRSKGLSKEEMLAMPWIWPHEEGLPGGQV